MKALTAIVISIICCVFLAMDTQAKAKSEPQPLQINQRELLEGVMSLADSWLAQVSQGYQAFESQVDSPELRVQAKKMRFASMTSAIEIATIPYPGRAMLDLMVLSSLNRATWENHWLDVYGAPAQKLADTHTRLEQEIWQYSARFSTEEQRAELKKLVDLWLAEHPDAKTASFVRFSDFGSLRGSPALVAATKPGGWLSTARDAAAAAQGIQELSERALYLALRMQELIASRFELSVAETMAAPEIRLLLEDISAFRLVAEDYAVLMEKLPSEFTREIDGLIESSLLKIRAERETMIEQAMSEISVEREAAVIQLMESISQERAAALDQTLKGVEIERKALLKMVAAIIVWSDLQAKAMFARVFVLSCCLILLYFLLRLVYRYERSRETFSIRDVLRTILLLFITALPIIAIGVLYVEYSKPDMQRMDQLQVEFQTTEAELMRP